MRRPAVIIATLACALFLLLPGTHAAATSPAPPGQASGVALQAGSLADISKSEATADSSSPSAHASAIRLQGQPLLNLGGTQTGDGENGGALVDSEGALPARLQVAPWHAAVRGSGGPARESKSSAALLRATVPNQASAAVLTSNSEASHTEHQSRGTALSDGLNVAAGSSKLVVLHSEAAAEGQGRSYLVGVNDTQIGADDPVGKSPLCALQAPSLLALSCLTASGGAAAAAGEATTSTAEVARVTPAPDALRLLNPLVAISTAASAGPSVTLPGAPAAAAAETVRSTGELGPAVTQTGGEATGQLPRTGTNMLPSLMSALAILGGGLGLRRLRPRAAAG
jgi:hypothetical protein